MIELPVITHLHYAVLNSLRTTPTTPRNKIVTPTLATEIGEALGYRRSKLYQLLSRMEQMGLITQTDNLGRTEVCITPSGCEAYRSVKAFYQ